MHVPGGSLITVTEYRVDIEVLNTVDQLSTQFFLAIHTEHSAHNRRLRDGKHIIEVSELPRNLPSIEEIG